jgi:glutathione S-transferase
MLNIFHVPNTRSFRVIWLCEELALPYKLTAVDFSAAYRESPEWRALNPVGKVPVMIDGELIMFESGAMVQYLLDRYGDGALQPICGTPEHAHYLQWSWFAEATYSRPIGEVVNHRRAFGDAAKPDVMQEMSGRAALASQAVNDALTGQPYLLGNEFSAADIMMGYTVMLVAQVLKQTLPESLAHYWASLQGRAAFIAAKAAERAMAK